MALFRYNEMAAPPKTAAKADRLAAILPINSKLAAEYAKDFWDIVTKAGDTPVVLTDQEIIIKKVGNGDDAFRYLIWHGIVTFKIDTNTNLTVIVTSADEPGKYRVDLVLLGQKVGVIRAIRAKFSDEVMRSEDRVTTEVSPEELAELDRLKVSTAKVKHLHKDGDRQDDRLIGRIVMDNVPMPRLAKAAHRVRNAIAKAIEIIRDETSQTEAIQSVVLDDDAAWAVVKSDDGREVAIGNPRGTGIKTVGNSARNEGMDYSHAERASEGQRDAIHWVVKTFRSNPDAKQPWEPLNADRVKKVWTDYAKMGFVRDERGVDNFVSQTIRNIWRLWANTLIAGRLPEDPVTTLEDEELEPLTKEENEKFDEHVDRRVSDFAFHYLEPLVLNLYRAKTAEQKLLAVDMVFNVVHQRSDLAGEFIQGGQKTLNDLQGFSDHDTMKKTTDDIRKELAREGIEHVVDDPRGKRIEPYRSRDRHFEDLYHGTNQDFNSMQPDRNGIIWLAGEPQVAVLYAYRKCGGKKQILKVKLNDPGGSEIINATTIGGVNYLLSIIGHLPVVKKYTGGYVPQHTDPKIYQNNWWIQNRAAVKALLQHDVKAVWMNDSNSIPPKARGKVKEEEGDYGRLSQGDLRHHTLAVLDPSILKIDSKDVLEAVSEPVEPGKIPTFEEAWEDLEKNSDSIREAMRDLRKDGAWDDYEAEMKSQGKTALGKEDEWKTFDAWCMAQVKEWGQSRYEEAVETIKHAGGKKCWRCITLPKGTDPAKVTSVGRYWSLSRSGAKAYYGKEGDDVVTYEGVVDLEGIDWMQAIVARMNFISGDDEDEVAFLPGRKIKVNSVTAKSGKAIKIGAMLGTDSKNGIDNQNVSESTSSNDIPSTKATAVPLNDLVSMLAKKNVTKYWGSGLTGQLWYERHITRELSDMVGEEYDGKKLGDYQAYLTRSGSIVIVHDGKSETVGKVHKYDKDDNDLLED